MVLHSCPNVHIIFQMLHFVSILGTQLPVAIDVGVIACARLNLSCKIGPMPRDMLSVNTWFQVARIFNSLSPDKFHRQFAITCYLGVIDCARHI